MVHYYDSISPDLQEWIMKQPCFFTASAPLHGRHVNLSPKGLPSTSFSVLTPNLVGYVDATGSGIETVSHIQENGRCTIMFCSFDASPRIMRLFCTGRIVPWDHPQFNDWRQRMGNKHFEGMRAVILLDVWKVQTSCGYAVPYLALKPDPEDSSKQVPYLEDRQTLGHWGKKQISNGIMNDYRAKMNSRSLDGLPGLRVARKDIGESLWLRDVEAQVKKRNGAQLGLVALLSACLTILTMYLLGCVSFPDLERWAQSYARY
ncbi:uncharacterized protein HMPREF1541_04021 [Cyphellophora europaea CBS 101466]|uniref:Pyridoxamine 5'-phosphate oxidase N-terminal domain-containing protein n=1 Tax=Cyphellophora europaea (strain CBS 101466) TaxID=1220924 RepID=W2S066_CYPE1|nr:uncharacterized protein HMPREF1541_04021 [Cyphellophora europaea CBS 101466]ETN42082.1 hypothetical protein HMPREF1541_04021 [Cyphellophora europaea CBS 101466]